MNFLRVTVESRAASLVEVIVAMSIGVVILAGVTALWGSGMKSGRAAQSSEMATALALMEMSLREDVAQMGVDSVCPLPDTCRVDSSGSAFAFEKATFDDADPKTIFVHPVIYRAQTLKSGNICLTREEWGRRERCGQAVMDSVSFQVIKEAGGNFLRVSGRMLDDDAPARADVRALAFMILLRLPEPVQLCNTNLGHAIHWARKGPGPGLFDMSLP